MKEYLKHFFIVEFLILFASSPVSLASFVIVKGSDFTPLYGSSKNPVYISDFEMDEFPVTNQDFLEFVKTHQNWQKSKIKKIFADPTYLAHWTNDFAFKENILQEAPVVNVSWFAAKAYCEAKQARLPTVSEWEYAASREIAGMNISKYILDWYSQPTPEFLPSVRVGKKNVSGIYALHGLIWEWTLDFNSAMVTGESRGDSSLDKSLYCGAGATGAANPEDYAAFMRFAFRSSLKAKYTVNNLGFRCVKDKSETKK